MHNRTHNIILTAILVCVILAVNVSGQVSPPTRQSESSQPRIVAPQGVDQRLLTVRKLMRFRQYDMAGELLEVVLAERPGDVVTQNLLMSCYEQTRQFFKAETLARRVVAQSPDNLQFRVKLAEVLILQEKVEEGKLVYQETLGTVRQFNMEQCLMIITSMAGHDLAETAMGVIDSLRLDQSDPILFSLERGALLERQLKYREAAEEYTGVLSEDTTTSARTAEKRLIKLLEFADSSEEVEKGLLVLADQTHNLGATRVLASYYIKSGRFDDAFDFAVQQDSLGDAVGNSLLFFLYQCADRKLHSQVARMSEFIFANFGETPFVGDVTFRYAEALRGLGRYQEAISVYSSIEAEALDVRSKSEALYSIGRIYLDGLLDFPAALVCFDSVRTTYRGGVSYLQAARSIPIVHLRMGNIDLSRKHCDALKNRHLNDDMREEVDYHLALLDLFDADYDSAEVGFRKLMVDYPRGYFVNDALSMVMLISDAKGVPELLARYSSALFYSERLMIDSARVKLVEVVENDDSTLADVALYNLAELETDTGNDDEALVYLDHLVERFPESYYHPHGLKLKADILVKRVEYVEDAREIYRYLLENYPNHPSITDVRTKLRELEGEPIVG